MNKFPSLLAILEAVFECYEKKGKATDSFKLSRNEVWEVLRGKGFQITDDMVWERLVEFNNTIKVVRQNISESVVGTNYSYDPVYYLCQGVVEQDQSFSKFDLEFKTGVRRILLPK